MKKVSVIAILAALCVLVSSCSMFDDLLNSTKGEFAEPEKVYAELDSLISKPDQSSKMGKVSFVAYIASEPFEETFDGEDKTYMYQDAYIARNDKVFALDVTDISDRPDEDSFVTITGTFTGSIYWTEDNERVQVMNFHADKIEAFTVSDAEPNTSNKFSLKSGTSQGEFEFVGAHYSEDSFRDVVVVYFKFKNTGEASNTKFNNVNSLLGAADFWYDNIEDSLSGSSFDPDELDSGALAASDMQAYTYPGKTQLYYKVFQLKEGISHPVLGITVYNDEFALVNDIQIDIAENLAAMQG